MEDRFIKIEIALANAEKMLEELNDVVVEQGKTLDLLLKQNKMLMEVVQQEGVKPLSEETPPPHY